MSVDAFSNLFRTIVASRRDSYASRLLGFRFECHVFPHWNEVCDVFSTAIERDFSISKGKINRREANWALWYQTHIRGHCDFRLEDDSMFSAEVERINNQCDGDRTPGFRTQLGDNWAVSFGVDEEKFKNVTGLEEPSLTEENYWRIENRFGVFAIKKGILIGEKEMFLKVDVPATLHYLCELVLMIRKGGAKLTDLVKPFELEIIKSENYRDAQIKIPTAPDFICICDFMGGYFVLRNKYVDLHILVRPTLERYEKWPLG
jgi:hypothetical protein